MSTERPMWDYDPCDGEQAMLIFGNYYSESSHTQQVFIETCYGSLTLFT